MIRLTLLIGLSILCDLIFSTTSLFGLVSLTLALVIALWFETQRFKSNSRNRYLAISLIILGYSLLFQYNLGVIFFGLGAALILSNLLSRYIAENLYKQILFYLLFFNLLVLGLVVLGNRPSIGWIILFTTVNTALSLGWAFILKKYA
jgi:hypothetical protein